ncbi:response regulator [Pseudodesulfovibrio tunisiensis]|uniref:response regulator n=1 Tax=Pseudodesulfovibrio tunisiensis TaxID=463192 RepID=UPI001FB28318|nr:response regulator [Pseudodesulfovibrio tunisiensis]
MTKPKLLIVDDDERFCLLMTTRLKTHANCISTTDGKEALLLFEHHLREGQPFHAVLMDIEMPDMDGHQVVQQMRKIERSNGVDPLHSFKLVMLTAHSDVKNVSKSFFRNGADAYVPKAEADSSLLEKLREIGITTQ